MLFDKSAVAYAHAKKTPVPKGLAHYFRQNLNTFLNLIFLEKDLDIMFNNDLNGKKRLSREQKCHFNIVAQCSLFQRG